MCFPMYVPLHLCMISLYRFHAKVHCSIARFGAESQTLHLDVERPKKRRWVTLLDGISHEVDVTQAAQVAKLEEPELMSSDEFSSHVLSLCQGAPLFFRCQTEKS